MLPRGRLAHRRRDAEVRLKVGRMYPVDEPAARDAGVVRPAGRRQALAQRMKPARGLRQTLGGLMRHGLARYLRVQSTGKSHDAQ